MRSKGIFHHHRREGCGDKHGVFGRGRGMRGGLGGGGDREDRGRGHGRRGGGRLFDHGSLRWLLLSLIAEKPAHEPSHGYELIKAVETRLGGAYSPSPGVIYPTLTLLEEMGALEATAQGGKKLYAITETGRALLAENAEAVAAVQARMDKFAAHVRRPEAIQEAIGRLHATVHARLTGETALTEAQVQAVADILNAAADGVEKA